MSPNQVFFLEDHLLPAIVAIDYFTKWIEAVPLARTTATEVKKFLWKNIICRFGLPQQIVTDRGPQFNTPIIRSWLEDMGILYTLASTQHAESNGQVEAANKSIVEDLGKRCMEAKGKWAEYLPLTLWANRTTPKAATGESPFALAYGIEAVVPVEHLFPSDRLMNYNEDTNNDTLAVELELREEIREMASIHSARQKAIVARHYNKKVRPRGFKRGNLVLRRCEGGKLDPHWEGPFIVDAEVAPGAYRLLDADGNRVPNTWNVAKLRRYYP